MIRPLRILTLVAVLAGPVQPGHAQHRSSAPTSQGVLDEASQLNQRVEKLYSEGKFAEAVPVAERALALREKALEPMHPDVAQSLDHLAELYRAQGAYGKAEPLHVRALDIREKALGPMHPDVAQSLDHLAELYRAQGALLKAEPLHVRALDIREKALGPMHPDVAQSLDDLAGPAVILAGPDYGPLPSDPAPGTVAFLSLPGARAEAADLRRYFSTPPVTDKQATKEALAALVGPTMLHVATHGFYAREPGTASAPGSRGPSASPPEGSASPALRGMHVENDDGMSSLSPPSSSDPAEALDRSGLAMAGANQGAQGIVTAREIAGFDWWGTQLVVLSACETGVGAVPSGEGVYGMRRALVLAGTESQVVSLWSVSDASTRTLMHDYYDELAHGIGRAEALRSAKLHLLHQPRYAHPYYWAAFIPAGDWRPLDKTVFSHGGSSQNAPATTSP